MSAVLDTAAVIAGDRTRKTPEIKLAVGGDIHILDHGSLTEYCEKSAVIERSFGSGMSDAVVGGRLYAEFVKRMSASVKYSAERVG